MEIFSRLNCFKKNKKIAPYLSCQICGKKLIIKKTKFYICHNCKQRLDMIELSNRENNE